MTRYQISEKTLAMIPAIIKKERINVPIYRIEETETLVRFYLYGHKRSFIARKPKPRKPRKPRAKVQA